MWELVNQLSHGRYPARRFSLMVMSAVLTFFVATAAFTTPVHADDTTATRNGDTISYLGNTYTEVKKEELPKDIQAKAQGGYKYIDTTGKKAYFIYTTDAPSKAATGSYVIYDFTPPDTFTGSSPPVEVTFDDGTSASTSDCGTPEIGGIGWFVCPVVSFLAGAMDTIYGVISGFLVINTVTNDTDSSIYQLWMVVRDIANICFVIAILAVVYSQITSIGITNYGIKKILPRLIVAAILVNVSFWICALGVDASNILGYGIHSLFTGILEKFNVGVNYTDTVPTWEMISAIALSGGGALLGVHWVVVGGIYYVLPLLVGALIAVLVALIILAARQALITVLIIVSPLAFVAYILPNTEKWFTKWRETLMTMLLLFPIFSAVFSGAQLAGMAIIQSANGNFFTLVLGLAVIVAPIVITPLLVKFSGSLIGRIAGMVNNPTKGMYDRSKNWAAAMSKDRKNNMMTNKHANKAWNLSSRALKAGDSIRRRQEGRRKALETAADNRFSETKWGHDVDRMNRTENLRKEGIESRHQEAWDNARRTNPKLLNLDLEVKRSESNAAAAKEKLEKMHAEIATQGHNSEYIMNLRGVDARTQAGMLNIAHDINRARIETTLTSAAKTEAEHALSSATNEVLLKNSMKFDGMDARKYAAGIGDEANILASAVARERKEFGESSGYQKELASHFKLNAGQIEKLAMAKGSVTVTDDHGNEHTFDVNNAYTRDMAVEEIFTVGAHGQKMDVLKSTAKGRINYENRRTIQQAAIKSGISSIAPAVNDKTLDAIINGEFDGDESWMYHSLREVLEGRLKAQSLSTSNVGSLKLLFADPASDPVAKVQFDKLLKDSIPSELEALQVTDPSATEADARSSLLSKFSEERENMRRMAAQVLSTETIRQNTNSQSAAALKQFAGSLYKGK